MSPGNWDHSPTVDNHISNMVPKISESAEKMQTSTTKIKSDPTKVQTTELFGIRKPDTVCSISFYTIFVSNLNFGG